MKKIILALALLLLGAPIAHANMNVLFSPEDEPEAWCLAQNIYFESRGSSFADQAAVADVVLNRVGDRRYPDTICKVVRQGKYMPSWKDQTKLIPVRNQCQFSWWCDGKSDYPTNKEAWAKAQQIAYMMIKYQEYRGLTEGATHYHADYVNPKWARNLQLVGRIGEHIFYRWK